MSAVRRGADGRRRIGGWRGANLPELWRGRTPLTAPPSEELSDEEYSIRLDEDEIATAPIAPATVSAYPSPHNTSSPSAELAGEGYALREEPSPARPEPSLQPRWHNRVYAEEEADRPEEADQPPRRPLLDGVFEFPFRRDGAACLLHLWFWGVPTLFLFALAGLLSRLGANLEGSGDPAASAWGFFALAAAFTAPWLALSSACGLRILSETAAGRDRIDDFPRLLDYRDWFGDALFVVNSFVLCSLPAAALGWLADLAGCEPGLASLAGGQALLGLFPIVLLSMLENDSRIAPFSPLVFHSLGRHGRAWGIFYAESAALGLVPPIAMAAIINMPMPFAAVFAWLLFPMIFSATLMIYFRLLGRLAWCCSDEEDGHARG